MTQEITKITPGNPVESLSDRELLERIDARLGDLEADFARLLAAWSLGGIKGLRAAAKGLNHGR